MGSDERKLRDQLFVSLRDRIINLSYSPGTVLSEKDLCQEFKVSRAPVREAVRKLEDLNLVRALPRYGTRVTPMDIEEFRCAVEVKRYLESLAASLAAQRVTSEQLGELRELIDTMEGQPENPAYTEIMSLENRFHEVVYLASGNWILAQVLENLNIRCARFFHSTLGGVIQASEVVEQMRGIYEALEAKDSEKAGLCSTAHSQYFIDRLKETLF